MIIDVHAHLDFLDENKLKEIQKNRYIKLVITNSINLKSCERNLEISKKYSKIKLAVGLYPEKKNNLIELRKLDKFVKENKKEILAIGEIGLDKTEELDFKTQEKIFRKQLEIAEKFKVPVIIHTRKAEKEVLDIIKDYKCKKILHCFSGKLKLVKQAVELGCYFSIPTNIVRAEHFQKLVEIVPKENILTETDAPYLSPFKERRNEPKFISESIKVISKIWKMSIKETENKIEKNFNSLFKE